MDDFLIILLFIVGWFFIQGWLLPRLGIPT
jgi:hypothetical protein